tara:strand:+ start:203 stop:451 length:249 start_codon:yes stop_codon:yes gene_type:complete
MAKITKTFICEHTGIKTIYTYQDSIVNGMQSVEIEYPKGYLDKFAKEQERADNLPKTKRLYFNPATGKDVSYARARAIGLLK